MEILLGWEIMLGLEIWLCWSVLEILLVYRFGCAGLGWAGDIKFVCVGDMVVLG